MKKIYSTPNTLIIEVNTNPFMNLSFNGNGGSVSVSNTGYDSEKGAILSRRGGGDWDDED